MGEIILSNKVLYQSSMMTITLKPKGFDGNAVAVATTSVNHIKEVSVAVVSIVKIDHIPDHISVDTCCVLLMCVCEYIRTLAY